MDLTSVSSTWKADSRRVHTDTKMDEINIEFVRSQNQ